MFMTLFLERMGELSSTKTCCSQTLQAYFERFTNVEIHFSGKQLSQPILCCKYDFQIVQIQKFLNNFRKSIIMVKVFRYLAILVVATHSYSKKTVLKYFTKFA